MRTILATGLAQPQRLSNGLATIKSRILAANPSASVAVPHTAPEGPYRR